MANLERRYGTDPLVQLSSRGGVTLPSEIRKAIGLRPGDPLQVRVEDGRILLEPVVVLPVERYSDERIREFERESEMTEAEMKEARNRWGMA